MRIDVVLISMRMPKLCTRRLGSAWAFLFLLSLVSFSIQAEQPGHALGLVQQCVEEPVFGHRACFYRNAVQADRKTLLLIHGLSGNALDDWREQVPVFSAHYNIFLVDLPGFGASSNEAADYSPDNYVRYIHFLHQTYIEQPVIVVGHSMGAVIGLQFAAQHVDSVDRVFAANVAGMLHKIAYSKTVARSWVSRFFGDAWGDFFGRLTGEWMGRVEGGRDPRAPLKMAGEGYEPALIAGYRLIYNNFAPYASMVEVPVQLLWLRGDKVAPLRTGEALVARLPYAQLEVIDAAGHVPMTSHVAQFNQSLQTFIETDVEVFKQQSQLRRHKPRKGLDDWRAVCQFRETMEFEGDFELLEIANCSHVRIVNSSIRELRIHESRVEIENSDLGRTHIVGSDVLITGGVIEGDVALTVSRSRIDLAGVTMRGGESSVLIEVPSELVFSISELNSRFFNGPAHGLFSLLTGDRL